MAAQRFCPVCDRAFEADDAVLRCAGCGVLYHPRCWVQEDGCTTPGEHDRTPQALAYRDEATRPLRPSHPAEGTRRRLEPPAIVVERESLAEPEPPSAEPTVVIGAEKPQHPAREAPSGSVPPRPHPPSVPYRPRAAKGGPSGLAIYRRTSLLRYWYVPAAVGLAVLVALAVIFVGERLLDGGGEERPAAAESPTVAPAAGGETPAPTPPPETRTPAADESPTPTPTAIGRFVPGDRLRVTGTGGCLNIREEPTLQGPILWCLPDGETVEVLGGPEVADGYIWWQVRTNDGQGWAAEEYLERAE